MFPSPFSSRSDGLLAVGGDLSSERLLLAYSQGIFPWYEEDPILWWCPQTRAILRPEDVHVSRSLKKVIDKNQFEIRYDTNFQAVILACAKTKRKDQEGTWIGKAMQEAYMELFEQGFAHSIEAYQAGLLVGGLYGVSLGGVFCGESMFSLQPNASKVALVSLANQLRLWGYDLIDCQIISEHLRSLGAYEVDRTYFLQTLSESLKKPTYKGHWKKDNPDG